MNKTCLAALAILVCSTSSSAHAGVITKGAFAIKCGPMVEDVQYPGDTVFDLLVRNDGDRAISIPTKNLMVTSEVRADLTTVWITIPEARRSDDSPVLPSRASLGIVVLEPGKEMVLSIHTSCCVNLGAPIVVRLSIDPTSSARFGIISGEHEVTLPKFLPDDIAEGYTPPRCD